jgi:hypothetical protein
MLWVHCSSVSRAGSGDDCYIASPDLFLLQDLTPSLKLVHNDFTNGSGHGLDMVFRKASGSDGRYTYAVMEAKNGEIGALDYLKIGTKARQGSRDYIKHQLRKYKELEGADVKLANTMLKQLKSYDLESYVAARGSDRLAQFNLQNYTSGINQNLKRNDLFLRKDIP